MRILRVHNRYQERGGEDVSYDTECQLLRSNGEDVYSLLFSNDDIAEHRSHRDSLKLALSTVWSRSGKDTIASAIEHFHPNVVHFDNTFPLISPSAYSACKAAKVPVVQSLRNYRLLCPTATFFRDGHVCEDCMGKPLPLPGVIHSCYRESRAQSTVVASMITFHRLRRTWHTDVDRFVALTAFARDKYVEGGLPEDRIVVKPNSVHVPQLQSKQYAEGFLFVGRLTVEKGVNTLLSSWSGVRDLQLTLIGDGPLRSSVDEFASKHSRVNVKGRLGPDETYAHMRAAQTLIFPSEWYETFGRVAIESFAQQTPVIAANIGAVAEVVRNGVTGILFEPGNADDLAAKVRWAADHPAEMRQMGENARVEYQLKYTPERNYEMLMDVYQQAIDHAKLSHN